VALNLPKTQECLRKKKQKQRLQLFLDPKKEATLKTNQEWRKLKLKKGKKRKTIKERTKEDQ